MFLETFTIVGALLGASIALVSGRGVLFTCLVLGVLVYALFLRPVSS